MANGSLPQNKEPRKKKNSPLPPLGPEKMPQGGMKNWKRKNLSLIFILLLGGLILFQLLDRQSQNSQLT